MDRLVAGAQGAGLVSQLPELTHLVTNIRQEWDKSTQTFQYQLQSYTNNNEYFMIDLGTHLDQATERSSGEFEASSQKERSGSFVGASAYAQASGDIQYPMKWRFSQPAFNLNICVSAFVPVVNQA